MTLGLVKEAVFQILAGRLQSGADDDFSRSACAFFDVCAGSGQMGFEALSRGFDPVHLTEVDSGRLRHLIAEAKRGAYALEVHRRDFRRAAPLILQQQRSVVFVDPPYSFWDRGHSEAVDRLLYNLRRPSEEVRERMPENVEVHFVVHGPDEYLPAPEILPDDAAARLQVTWLERRDYRKQRLLFLTMSTTSNTSS